MNKSFKQLLQASFKSNDTEEWLDVYFTRPIGLAFALMWIKIGVTPNFVTILSMFLGAAAGYCFIHTELWWNVAGVLFMLFANFCDSTDGQMARLTGKKTLIGRMLDGFSGDLWFVAVYLGIVFRLWHQNIPGTQVEWSFWALLLCALAGFHFHSNQSSLADYYRQIHLYFLLGKEGSELDNYKQQRAIYEGLPKEKWLDRLFYFNYANYCHSQEKRTPAFQAFFKKVKAQWPNAEDMPQTLRNEFRRRSLPLMKYTNLLTFNSRAITIYVTCLLDCPWVYPLLELTVFQAMYVYMHRTHENICRELL